MEPDAPLDPLGFYMKHESREEGNWGAVLLPTFSLPGSPVPGILQARTLEWVAIYFSNLFLKGQSMKISASGKAMGGKCSDPRTVWQWRLSTANLVLPNFKENATAYLGRNPQD